MSAAMHLSRCIRAVGSQQTIRQNLTLLRSRLQGQFKISFSNTKLKLCSRVLRSLRLTTIGAGTYAAVYQSVRFGQCKAQSRLEGGRSQHVEAYPLTWTELWEIIRPYFHYFILATFGAIVVALLNIRLPILLGELINVIASLLNRESGTTERQFGALNLISGKLLLYYAGQAFFTFFYITCLALMGERMAADLRIKLLGKLLHHDMSFFDEHRSGELSDHINTDVQEFKSNFKLCVAQGLRTFAQISGCFVSLFLISPKMTVVTVAVIPLVVLLGSFFGGMLRYWSAQAQLQGSIAAGVADEAIQNIRTVKTFATEDLEQSLYAQQIHKAQVMNEKLGAGIGLFQAGTNVFLNGIVLGILYGGAHLMATTDFTPGQLMSFLVTSQTIQRSLAQLSLVFGHAIRCWSSCGNIVQLLKMKTTNEGGTQRIPYHSLVGEIEFEDIHFTYPTRPDKVVFDNLSLKFKAGQTVALCGPSGAGKSTIIALIERLYEPQSGHVKLDGRDLRHLDPYWLRRNVIGIISQEPVLFATTIEENIRYGRPEATDEEVREAARLANAHEFIETFPAQYQTLVGERGVALSGGEKQRIAVARALLKDPPILILDEATSALDQFSENKVQEALARVMKNRTVIIIAHRLSTIRNADVIYVVTNGQICEQGSHDALVKQQGIYAAMVKMQQQKH